MFRRETIIALRARHQAYRIAAAILYPILYAPPPPEPAIPPKYRPGAGGYQVISPEEIERLVQETNRREQIRERRKQLRILAIMTLGLVAMVVIMLRDAK